MVFNLGFTKAGLRKGAQEQVTITDKSLASLLTCFSRDRSSTATLVSLSPCNFRKYFSRLLSFFGLGQEGYTLHSLRRGGATHFFRVTGNLSATLERGRWISVSSGRIYITEGLSVLAHRKINPAAAEKLVIASEALPGGGEGGGVGGCHLESQCAFEARVTPAGPACLLQRNDRNLWRITDAKNHVCSQVSSPIFSGMICPRRATDRDLQSSSAIKKKGVNAWICVCQATDQDLETKK